MKQFVLLLAALGAPLGALACDGCGLYLGIQPNDRVSTVGLYWRYRLMQGTTFIPNGSHLLKHGDEPTAGESTAVPITEMVNVVELRADLRLSERFYLLASMPVVNSYRSVNNYEVLDAYGPGDPLVIARYQVWNTRSADDAGRTVHRLLIGAGLKLPVGRTDLEVDGELVSPDVQLGTGSWDPLATIEYGLRRGRSSLGIVALGRYNTANVRGYQLGHGLNLTAELSHRWGNDTLSIAPLLGAYAELMDKDRDHGEVLTGTGSSILFGHVGVRLWWKRVSLSAFFQPALTEDEGELITPTRHRAVVGITYAFNKN